MDASLVRYTYFIYNIKRDIEGANCVFKTKAAAPAAIDHLPALPRSTMTSLVDPILMG